MATSPTPTVENNGRVIEADSSNIHSVAYDVDTHALDVYFHVSGAVVSQYRYFDVPAEVVTNLLFASSQGRAFIALVKNGGFSYCKMEA